MSAQSGQQQPSWMSTLSDLSRYTPVGAAVGAGVDFASNLGRQAYGYAQGKIQKHFEPELRQAMLAGARDVSGDRDFGRKVGEQIATKLQTGGLSDVMAGKVDQAVGGWIQGMPEFLRPLASPFFKSSQVMTPEFGEQMGSTIAAPNKPFTEGAAGAVASNLVTPQNLVGVIDKTQFTSPVKSMMRFMATGNVAGKGGLMEDIMGGDLWSALKGQGGATT